MALPIFSMPDFRNVTRKRKVIPDPLEEINKYNQPIQQSPQGRSRMDVLGNIINAIASGVAVGTSDNPSETLMHQLTQQRQANMQREQMLYEREQQKAQQEFQRQMKEREIQADKERQQTDIVFKKESQTEEFKQQMSILDRRFLDDVELQREHGKVQEGLLRLRNTFDISADARKLDMSTALKNLDIQGDTKLLKIRGLQAALLAATKYHNPVPTSKVYELISKIEKDQVFTKEDFKDVDTLNKVLVSAQGGGGVSGGGLGKYAPKTAFEIAKDDSDFLSKILSGDRVVERDPDTGEIQIKESSKEDLLKRASDLMEIRNVLLGGQGYIRTVLPDGSTITKFPTTKSAEITPSELETLNMLNNLLDRGVDPKSIRLDNLPPNIRKQVEARIKAKSGSSRYRIKGF